VGAVDWKAVVVPVEIGVVPAVVVGLVLKQMELALSALQSLCLRLRQWRPSPLHPT
jgi:hypothetical protein